MDSYADFIDNNTTDNNFFNNDFDLTDDSLISGRTYQCPNCLQYPIIHYCDNINIEVTCTCYNKKRMTINEFLDPIGNPFKSSLLSFSLYLEDYIKKERKEYNESRNTCIIHKKKFKYYCNDCELNLCEDCFENHNFHNLQII